MVEQRLNEVLHALTDPTRRQILGRLSQSERSVGELAAPLPMSLAAVSKHIKVLERAGLLRREVRGRTHICRLTPEPLAQVRGWLRHYERFWTHSLDALERELQNDPTGATSNE